MEGFYNKKDTKSKSRPDGKVHSCASCGLYKGCISPKMREHGEGKKDILIIGEAPGDTEDKKGMQWQGKTGRLLRQTLNEMEVDLFEDCVSINAVNCQPIQNRTPTRYEIDCCRSVIVSKVMEEYQPKVIILLGNSALASFLGDRWATDLGGITKWRGFKIPDQDYKCWVIPTFHPSYVQREDSKETTLIWEQDLRLAISAASEQFQRTPAPNIEYLEDLSELERYRPYISELAFDFETTGLKPQGKGHRVICAAVTVQEDKTLAFMMPKSRKGRQPFLDLLQEASVMKLAHNMKFEDHWTKIRLRVDVDGWGWDSMLAAHMLDNRKYVTGLKFQTYVNFGIVDYASEVTPWLKGIEKGGNAFNKIDELLERDGGPEMLMEYCALDTFYQFMLAKKQMREMDYTFLPF